MTRALQVAVEAAFQNTAILRKGIIEDLYLYALTR